MQSVPSTLMPAARWARLASLFRPGRRAVLAVLASSVVLVAGCNPSAPTAEADAAAVVDGRPVPRLELELELERARGKGRTNRQEVVEEWLQRERLVARARRLGLENDPETQRAWKNLLVARLKDRELEPRLREAKVTEEDVQRLVPDSSPAGVEQVRLAVVRVDLGAKASPSKTREAEERIGRAREKALALPRETAGFGAVAAEFSDDEETRSAGGDLGWFELNPDRYHLDREVLAAGFGLRKVGEISAVVRGRDGFYLVRLVDRRTGAGRSRAPVEAEARHRAILEKRRQIEAEFADETRRMIPAELKAGPAGAGPR